MSRMCLYPNCEVDPRCRTKDEYFSHSSYATMVCSSVGDEDHKWICDAHWDLLEFLKSSDVLKFDVTLK